MGERLRRQREDRTILSEPERTRIRRPQPEPVPAIQQGDKSAASDDFYKLSRRAPWTPERIARFKTLWHRGDSAEAIGRELGINASAVATARARFRLVPRRALPGRPKTKTVPKIERVAFETSRLMEFCTERELVNQTGHGVYVWPLVIVKEGIDNALDACEEAEIVPVITLDIT